MSPFKKKGEFCKDKPSRFIVLYCLRTSADLLLEKAENETLQGTFVPAFHRTIYGANLRFVMSLSIYALKRWKWKLHNLFFHEICHGTKEVKKTMLSLLSLQLFPTPDTSAYKEQHLYKSQRKESLREEREVAGWARIFKRLWNPGIDSKEWIPPAYVAWRAGTITLFLLGP